jgi:hypothetical protein
MRKNIHVFSIPLLAAALCASCPAAVAKCSQVPAGSTFWIRLLQPVASYSSKPGEAVRGIVIESPQCDGELLFADGTVVAGQIKSVHRVGMGFRHEAASLEIEFERIFPGNGAPIEIRARVLEVDNAREKVKGGVIHGIRGTNTPQDRLSRRLQYLAMLYPDDSLWILPAYRALVPIFPEPEIYFPRGTDLFLELTAPLEMTNEINFAPANQEFDALDAYSLDEMMDTVPERSATPKGQDADVVNLAFIGSQEQVRKAFDAAGWMTADAICRRTALREIHAFLIVGNYAHGPMSKQLLKGEAADSTWEKGLDSLAKRHHLRIWRTPDTLQGQSIWFSAATREIGASLSLRRRAFVHQVDPNIDIEREMVVRDLTLAGCVDKVHVDRRSRMPHSVENATGEDMYTDAAIAFVKLKDCENPIFQTISDAPKIASRPPTKFARYLRRQVLSARDIWRENVVYGAYDASRMAIGAIRRRHVNSYNTGKQNIAQPVTTSVTSGLASASADD